MKVAEANFFDQTGGENQIAQAARLHGIAMASIAIVKETLHLLRDTTAEGFEENVEAHRIFVEQFEEVALKGCLLELPPRGSDRSAFLESSDQKKDEM